MRRSLWAVLLAGLPSVWTMSADAQPSTAATRCMALGQAALPGLKVTATRLVLAAPAGTVRFHPASSDTVPVALPAYCRVGGTIDSRTGVGGVEYGLGFALALPLEWNGRFMFQGGGGWNGVLREPFGRDTSGNAALARGFAVIATDGGHRNAGNPLAFFADQQASLDFAFNALPTVTRVGQFLAAQHYGHSPHHTYAMGCSTGGREAMLAAQRYPLLFDGVLAGAPAMYPWMSQLAGWNAEAAFARAAPRDSAGTLLLRQAFTEADERLLHGAVVSRCDALDGLADGEVHNLRACRFDPAELRCTAVSNGQCLSDGQIAALQVAFDGARDSHGERLTLGFPWDPGLLGEHVGNRASVLPSSVPTQFGARPEPFSVDTVIGQIRGNAIENLGEAARWTNLSTFHGHGGKMLLYHGAADPWFSINDTISYVERLAGANPGADFSRFYAIPGMGHCGDGGTEVFDLLGPLVEWVEGGTAPRTIVATSRTKPDHSRPLCPWPQYARYKGTGDPGSAANFRCIAD